MNFIGEFKKGQRGENEGLFLGEGLSNISEAINGLQRGMIIGVAASPKVGKSTFSDYAFIISPYLESLEKNIDFEVIYFSFEMDRVSKEFDFAVFFLNHDFKIERIKLEGEATFKGKKYIDLSSNYLRGRLKDDQGNLIKVKDSVLEALKIVYKDRIIPLFGEFSLDGKLINKGSIIFIQNKDTPTGLRNFLLDYAKYNGEFIYDSNKENKKIIGYNPVNSNKYVVVITDHLRKINSEKGYKIKETVDKYVQITVELRNWCNFSFIHIIHLNRLLTNIDRMIDSKEQLYPTGDDIKDTGNLSEECNHLFTMFDPNDSKYRLRSHFGLKIKDKYDNEIYPDMRTVHLVESRHAKFPQHFRVIMNGNLKKFEKFDTNEIN